MTYYVDYITIDSLFQRTTVSADTLEDAEKKVYEEHFDIDEIIDIKKKPNI